ncbi:MAG: hypothetical protein WBD27_10370 [Pyrinomonadaceae bacterium]
MSVIQCLVVNLIGKDNELVFACNFDDSLQAFWRVQCSCRIVRIDNDDAACSRRDLGADVGKIGQPFACLIANIMHRPPAGERHRARPERIIGSRNQYLITHIKQSVKRHCDQLGCSVAQIHIFNRDAMYLLFLAVMHHCLARSEQALAVRISGRVRKIENHVPHDLVGRFKAECRQVADVQLDYVLTLVLHSL